MKRGRDDDREARPDVDPGEPVAELRRFEPPVEDGFGKALRDRIELRSAASNYVTFACLATVDVALQFVEMLCRLIESPEDTEGGSP